MAPQYLEAIKKKNSANVCQLLQNVGASYGFDRRYELYRLCDWDIAFPD